MKNYKQIEQNHVSNLKKNKWDKLQVPHYLLSGHDNAMNRCSCWKMHKKTAQFSSICMDFILG